MTKITPEHLARSAFVYVRQSTADQVLNNHESRRRQYALVDRARALGWAAVEVIDDDLGRSGSGIARPGFEKLLAAICEGRVGAVVSIKASRLARNGRDWHTLLEFCGLVGTLILDEDGVYDPRHPNDRLLLVMKGHHERDGVVPLPPALARSPEAEGAPQRALPHRRRGLLQGAPRPHREGSRPPRPGGDRARLYQIRRAADGSAGSPLDAPRAPAFAGSRVWARGSKRYLEAARLQHPPPHADKPDLRRRIRLWADWQSRHHRGRPQADRARLSQGSQRLGGFDPRPPRGLH